LQTQSGAQLQISDKHTVDWHIIGSSMPQDKTLLAQKQGFLDIYPFLYKIQSALF
jgi:hypothetical protein